MLNTTSRCTQAQGHTHNFFLNTGSPPSDPHDSKTETPETHGTHESDDQGQMTSLNLRPGGEAHIRRHSMAFCQV